MKVAPVLIVGTPGKTGHCDSLEQIAWTPVRDDEILSFVRSSINSVWTLELLLLLHRDATKSWDAKELIVSLHANAQIITESMAILFEQGIAASNEDGRYHYSPRSYGLGTMVDGLAEMYAQKPVAVVKTIFSSPNEKIQTFANAFRFKR